MEEEFAALLRENFTNYRSVPELALYLPVPPLLEIIHEYSCGNEFEFETRLHQLRPWKSDEAVVSWILASTNEVVIRWRNATLTLVRTYWQTPKPPEALILCALTPVRDICNRSICWYHKSEEVICICGHPIFGN